MAVRNTKTGGARKRVAGEKPKGAVKTTKKLAEVNFPYKRNETSRLKTLDEQFSAKLRSAAVTKKTGKK